ncbi:HAD hydrolase [Phlebopus sp. FC_14]|nr:HAD hydrolase [Phlebopus sp. FC_14]
MRQLSTLHSQRYMCSEYVKSIPIKSFVRHRAAHKIASPLAFAFDIDGVLIRGEKAIPAAKRALSILDGNNEFRAKIPYILLTNGGGVSETTRCHKLSQQLGVQIDPEQYIQAHTILKSVVHKYADLPVLVLGGRCDTLRKVAEGYGFKHVYNALDVLAWNPSVWPYHDLTVDERASVKNTDFSNVNIAAIFAFHDPRDWGLDIQVMCDVIQSGGIIGGPYVPDHARKPVDLVFCNPDLIWRSDFERPRLGQGAFKEAFQAVFKSLTGAPYPRAQFGKPTEATYEFAEKILRHRLSSDHPTTSVYMVGDNPESDIAGANAARWKSILVRTGVYDPQRGPPTHRPTHEVEDVEQAVLWALKQEFRP